MRTCSWYVLLLIAPVVASSGCDGRPPTVQGSADSELAGQNANLLQRVKALDEIYDQKGIAAFLQAKACLMEPGKDWAEDPDYGIVGLVLLNDEVLFRGRADSVGREKELAVRLRVLATQIERHPGKSADAWRKFSDALLTFAFGNSQDVRDSAAVRLVTLYAKIAGCEEQWTGELSVEFGERP